MRTRFHLLAGGLVCSLAFVFSPAMGPNPKDPYASGIPGAIKKLLTGERFTPTMHACGPDGSFHTYTTWSGDTVSRDSFRPQNMTAQEAFEAELKKAANVMEVNRQPTQRYKARAVIENESGLVTILYQFDGFLGQITASSRSQAEAFEAFEENRNR